MNNQHQRFLDMFASPLTESANIATGEKIHAKIAKLDIDLFEDEDMPDLRTFKKTIERTVKELANDDGRIADSVGKEAFADLQVAWKLASRNINDLWAYYSK